MGRKLRPRNVFLMDDSDHQATTVLENLLAYHDLVQPCGWILIQDMKTTRMTGLPGPLAAQEAFLRRYPEYVERREYEYNLYTQHPQGWLQKVPKGSKCSPHIRTASETRKRMKQ